MFNSLMCITHGFPSFAFFPSFFSSLNPRYGLFGDAVNTASRMESNSTANRILCSESAAKLLKEQAPKMPLKRRGKIAVKGKGDMKVYWVGDGLIDVKESSVELLHSSGGKVGILEDDNDDSQVFAAPPESAPPK